MTINVLDSACRLIKAATGEEYGDYVTVMDVGVGTEDNDKQVWVSGNWNGDLGTRLSKALERIGVDCEWYDQVGTCSDCQKLLETHPTSYHWQPGYLTHDEGLVCFGCLELSDDSVLEEFNYIDNSSKAIPDVLARHLEEWGWESYNGTYENGWHPGQTDKPGEIFDKIKKESPELSVVFRLDETSQFYIRFTAWTKKRENNE